MPKPCPKSNFARRHLACVQHGPNCITYSMAAGISERISAFVEALPLKPGLRVLEIGCGPGVAARAVARRIGDGFILAIDRSENAIQLARAGSADEIASGRLDFRQVAIEDFILLPGDALFDIAFAMRVGALDGRHPDAGRAALAHIKAVLKPSGRLFIDGGDPLKEIDLVRGLPS
ncbi:methyltransferase domain-containing protein [Mesorhizobium sp. WSM4884]|uniref:SAM-dependent methyltransferase n=1 Tax=Mesorhizobium sp. WSM4884 TaxID=3038542 RepID=UPI002417F210|nr:methyltransferase domain-containing protein [Mesorhizobium sp. WSM4884]MDG4885407.1 methyltransferase domain-containing protein [Mesorhizobium sp. WSM4884]